MAALAPSSCVSLRECFHKQQGVALLGGRRRCASTVTVGGYVVESGNWRRGKRSKGEVKVGASRPDMSSRPMSMEMEGIGSAEELDEILEHAQEQSLVVIFDWMAEWCRKCIYLKPKLEKLAAEYYPRVRFYIVDVNKVPQTLVKRGNITKMPTIQLWKHKEWKDEVIGGHKAWEVINEVREMIHKHI